MADRIVVLRTQDPVSFVADACAALADAVSEPHGWCSSHGELAAAYAALVRAYVGLVRPSVGDEIQGRIIDHVLERLGQAERSEILTPVADIVDRLHGLLASEPALH
ncbi:MAG: hypothetical protein ACLPYW_10350 [Acidimicrobiales bacterium]